MKLVYYGYAFNNCVRVSVSLSWHPYTFDINRTMSVLDLTLKLTASRLVKTHCNNASSTMSIFPCHVL